MDNVIEDFKDRVEEIDNYLKMLEILLDPEVQIRIRDRTKSISKSESTLKGAFFLLLYSLVESTIKKGIERLYATINSEEECITFFKKEVAEIWFGQQCQSKIMEEFVNKVFENETLVLDTKVEFSGNLDAKKIREIFEKHSIRTIVHYRARKGGELLTVKTRRNNLAHGDSFSECGRDYTTADLHRIKKSTVVFLRGLLKNIEKHIGEKKYAI